MNGAIDLDPFRLATGRPGSPAWRFDPPGVTARLAAPAAAPFDAVAAWAAPHLPGGAACFARALGHGGVHLEGRPVQPSAPPARVAAGAQIAVHAFLREPERVPLGPDAVLLDRDGIVAVAKPPWITTVRCRASARLSLEARLRELLGAPALVAVHRLDRTTSGVVLFARSRDAAAFLGAELRAHRVVRRYLAWVSPAPDEAAFAVRGWITRGLHPQRLRFVLRPDPGPGRRSSDTRFRRLAAGGGRALLEALPVTGRTHQIRVHLAARGHPLVGDDLYGPAPVAGSDWSAERALLHAERVRFRAPDGAWLEVRAPLPADFAPGP